MSDPLWLAIIAAVPATLADIAAVSATRTHSAVKKVDAALVQVTVAVDGRLQQLLDATNAQGRQDERDSQDREELRTRCPLGKECPL